MQLNYRIGNGYLLKIVRDRAEQEDQRMMMRIMQRIKLNDDSLTCSDGGLHSDG